MKKAVEETSFDNLGLIPDILDALKSEGYTSPMPVQAKAIPPALKGMDIVGCAQTGTGKTAAFGLPIIQHIVNHPHPAKKQDKHHERPIRALIISPTRELARQIDERIRVYSSRTSLASAVIHGGVKQSPQVKSIKKGVDILTATPGRLLDLVGQGVVDLGNAEFFVLDEVDRMLDMGFIEDIWRIAGYLPAKRQTFFFSATIPSAIRSLIGNLLDGNNLVEIHINPEAPAADTVEQLIYLVEHKDKPKLLKHLLEKKYIERALVFTRTKARADMITGLLKSNRYNADVLHADLPQSKRNLALERFRKGRTRILVASDIAARGLDIEEVSHVINFELPREPEMYIHRIGRTGRAGATGQSISFCDIEERLILGQIENLLGREVAVETSHPYSSPHPRVSAETGKPDKEAGRGSLYRHRRPASRRL